MTTVANHLFADIMTKFGFPKYILKMEWDLNLNS